uniref:Magnesium-dependent phosphatase 1 n=1 Tax=Cacopsylla melanoneura TaxID=428564 RepID=A0A8D8ZFG0_9HEMI
MEDGSISRFPKLIAFDLDYTLWPFWVDTHVDPPFTKKGSKIVDRRGATIKFYDHVPDILTYLKHHNCLIAAASRTSEIRGANQLVDLFGWAKYFDYREIFPSEKTAHFANLKKATGIDYKDMLFFDDEMRNSVDVSPLGVTCILVKGGMTKSVLSEGLKKWGSKNPA